MAIDAGPVPPKAATQFAAMLEEIAAQMRPDLPGNTEWITIQAREHVA
ncbi:hypothetical protein [Amycolatopsis panacis]|nr:hypothetical protein [Amycolatopsis panacis]